MTPDERRDHVLELTDELTAIFIVDREGVCETAPCEGKHDPHGYAYRRSRPWKGGPLFPPVAVVSVDPGHSALAYQVALHELGHIATGPIRRKLDGEAAAWRWAIKHSGEEIDWAGLYTRLETYRDCRRCKPSTTYSRLLREAERRAA